ncbi:lamin tail domain-containing protein [Streptomyces sp. NPDC021020]|uniref:lamin tail domain-containing protein n=1 Tax=Streptomyces sp. NPDC021020 TaxID=3365109 RepID=UPI0037B75569
MSRIASRLAATVLAAGALVTVAALPASAAPAQHGRHQQMGAQVVLGSVHHTRDTRSARGLNDEWITVTNEGRRTVSLDHWTLTDADHHVYRFGHVTLRAHQSLRVHSGRGHNTYRDLYQGGTRSVWGSNDRATLRDARGHVVDTESWGHSHR